MASGCFDLLAADYDRTWTNSGAGRLQRDAVWRYLLPLFQAGDRVLDLGCGTGEDACRLVRMGVNVSALDASSAMVRIARSRGVSAEVGNIETIHALNGSFDGMISNFGAMNCVPELSALRAPLARLVRPGGHLVICLMSRFCLMESLSFAWQFRFRKAVRRWKGYACAERLGLDVFYPSARQVRCALAPEFCAVRRIGIGFTVPPAGLGDPSSTSLRVRGRIDGYIAGWPVLRGMADHQLHIFHRDQTLTGK
jgi:ubiquinone/menaquinone biosynthesis C-methylase UbiE